MTDNALIPALPPTPGARASGSFGSSPSPPGVPGRLSHIVTDGWALVLRDLSRLRHTPALLVAGILAPAGFLLGFGYLFGGAVAVPGSGVSAAAYREYLVPGILATTMVTGMVITAGTVADDVGRGIVDRLRSLPSARSAALLGRTVSNLIVSILSLAVMIGCGLIIGWRAHHGLGSALAGFGLLLLFGLALSWAGAYIGLVAHNRDVMEQLGPLIFSMPFYSAAFVPTTNMPAVLRGITEWNPVSAVVVACRRDFGNPGGTVPGGAWPLAHPTQAAIAYSVLILVLSIPSAVQRFHRRG
jgi:ABC-2 type transport system permease protein